MECKAVSLERFTHGDFMQRKDKLQHLEDWCSGMSN